MLSHPANNGLSIQLYEEILSEYRERFTNAEAMGDEDEKRKIQAKIDHYQSRLMEAEDVENANH